MPGPSIDPYENPVKGTRRKRRKSVVMAAAAAVAVAKLETKLRVRNRNRKRNRILEPKKAQGVVRAVHQRNPERQGNRLTRSRV